MSSTTWNWSALAPVKVYAILSIWVTPLFVTVKVMVVLAMPMPTLEKVAGDGEMVIGPVPVPVIVAESVWPAAPLMVTVPLSGVLNCGLNFTSLKQSGPAPVSGSVGVVVLL